VHKCAGALEAAGVEFLDERCKLHWAEMAADNVRGEGVRLRTRKP
jgi:hypothetical protein